MAAPEIVGTLNLAGSAGGTIAKAVVRLEDTTCADASSVVLGTTECDLVTDGSGRNRFRLSVPSALLEEGRQYSLSARAEVGVGAGKRQFGTVQNHPWHANGTGVTDLELRDLD